MLGFVTDLSAPTALDHITMRVYDDANTTLTSGEWKLPGEIAQDFRLPGSFALTQGDGVALVHVELVGTKLVGTTLDPDTMRPETVVTRTAGVAFADDSTLFFRMALVQSCQGMSCGAGQSCIEGKCRPALTNAVSILPYRAGLEAGVACDSGSTFIDTATNQPLATEGTGCKKNQWCGEGTCYGDQGQGLLWCTMPDHTCTGIDGWETCVIGQCGPELASCYGPSWREGKFAGPCESYARCKTACGCETACIEACAMNQPTVCTSCLGNVEACQLNSTTTCTPPTCDSPAT